MNNEEKWKISVFQFLDNMRLLFLMLKDCWRGTYGNCHGGALAC
jgi:hypothetical protein